MGGTGQSRRLLLLVVAFFSSGFLLRGQAFKATHAEVELLSPQSTIKPGSGLVVGVHFILEPGWHIYWVNPGDSGQPPSLKWTVPAGFSAGEIQSPRPERMQPSS